jgi:hypothetical protein
LTADIYGHLFKETSTQAMRRLDKMIPRSDDADGAETTAKETVQKKARM